MAEVLYREEGGRHFVSVQEGMISVTGPTIRANKRDITDRDLVRIAFAFEDPTLVELRMYRDVSTTPDTFSNRFEFALHRDEHRRQDLRDYLAKKLKWFESFVFDDLVQAKAFQDRCERDIVWRELKGEPEPIVDGWTHVTYTGNGNNQVIQHSLGFPPKMIITKTIMVSEIGRLTWQTR